MGFLDFLKGLGNSASQGLLNSGLNMLQQGNQYRLQSRLMEKQYQLNKELYDYEYQKESPAARVQQLHDAGLNTGLMYSNGVAGMQGSVGSVSGGSIGLGGASATDPASSLERLSSAQRQDTESMINRVKQIRENIGVILDNQQSLLNDLKRIKEEVEIANAMTEGAEKRARLQELYETRSDRYEQLRQSNLKLKEETKVLTETIGEKRASTELKKAQSATEKTEQALNEAKIKTESATQSEKYANVRNLEATAEGKQLDNALKDEFGRLLTEAEYAEILSRIANVEQDTQTKASVEKLNELRGKYTDEEFYLKVYDTLVLGTIDSFAHRRNSKVAEKVAERSNKMSDSTKISIAKLAWAVYSAKS